MQHPRCAVHVSAEAGRSRMTHTILQSPSCESSAGSIVNMAWQHGADMQLSFNLCWVSPQSKLLMPLLNTVSRLPS